MDSEPCLKAWAESLGGITYPLLSDFYPHGQVAQSYGVLRREGYGERAIFIIDRQGVIRYVDVHDIDHQPDNEVVFAELAKLQPATAGAPAARPAEPPPSPEPDADVVLYCTSWCMDCNKARRFLKARNVQFVEIDISRDRGAAARVRGWANGNETTPTFKIHGQVIVGYNEARLDAALAAGRLAQ